MNKQPTFEMNTRDGFTVSGWHEAGSMWLSVSHTSDPTGMFGEWTDGDRWPGDTAGDTGKRIVRNQARRMIRRARRMVADGADI